MRSCIGNLKATFSNLKTFRNVHIVITWSLEKPAARSNFENGQLMDLLLKKKKKKKTSFAVSGLWSEKPERHHFSCVCHQLHPLWQRHPKNKHIFHWTKFRGWVFGDSTYFLISTSTYIALFSFLKNLVSIKFNCSMMVS